MQVKQVNSTTVTVPTATQRPIPLKRNTPPTKNASPVISRKPKAQATPYDIPQLPPRAQSVLKHTVVDLPADKNSGDEHPIRPVVKPKKKPIPLPVAQPKPKQSVDVNEQLKTLQSSLDELSSRVKKLETQQLQLQNELSIKTHDLRGGLDNHTQDLSLFNPAKVSLRMISISQSIYIDEAIVGCKSH